MGHKYNDPSHGAAIREWERLFKAGQLVFVPLDDQLLHKLPDSVIEYLTMHVLSAGVEVLMGPMVLDQYLFKLSDDVVAFLACCPICESHSWGRPDFGDIDNNEALAHLYSRATGLDAAGVKALFDGIDKVQASQFN